MSGGLDGEVLRRLRDAGPQTRAELADWLGIPRTTLSAALRTLSTGGHIEDGPVAASSGGRRSVRVRTSVDRVVVALSLGERRVRVAIVEGDLTIQSGLSIDVVVSDPGDPGDADIIVERIRKATEQALQGRTPVAIGVATATAAPVSVDDVREPLSTFCPEERIVSLPAVRAMAIGEQRSGAARGIYDFLAIRLGSGTTAATVTGGRLAAGTTGRAGEIGHLRVDDFGPACACGRTGCLDSFVGSSALMSQATDLARRGLSSTLGTALERTGSIDLPDLVTAGRAEDPAITQLARDVGQRLGRVLAGMVAHSDPRRIILGGPIAALGSYLLSDLRSTVYRLAPARIAENLDVVVSELGDHAVLIGAGSAALEAWISEIQGSNHPIF